AIAQMASNAGILAEKLFTNFDRVPTSGTRKPRGVIGGLHHSDPTNHDGVVGAAILRAEEMVPAGSSGTEPHGVVVAGNDIHLDAEGGDGEVMNYVFAAHDKANIAASGNVDFIDFALAVGLLRFPHPLLADDVDVQRVVGCAAK